MSEKGKIVDRDPSVAVGGPTPLEPEPVGDDGPDGDEGGDGAEVERELEPA